MPDDAAAIRLRSHPHTQTPAASDHSITHAPPVTDQKNRQGPKSLKEMGQRDRAGFAHVRFWSTAEINQRPTGR